MRIKQTMFCFSITVLLTAFVAADTTIYFAPNGGFAKINKERKIQLKSGEEVTANLNYALIDMIERVPENGKIKIAMYAFSHKDTQKALIQAARDRGVTVKLILDACASWTTEIRDSLKKMISEEAELAKKENRRFDFQLKEIYPEVMKDRGRTRTLTDGTVIHGTMHEKFGIVYEEGNKMPLHAFCGSANISWGAGSLFAENRIFFKNEPAIGLQLAEEFSRLWNEYGTAATQNCKSERLFPVQGTWGPIQIVSNSKPTDVEHYQRIDDVLMKILQKVNPKGGTIDVAMFSFTHYQLANALLFLAQRNPGIKVRVLLDQTQIENDENHRGVMGEFMENRAHYRELKNFEVRYKWRSNAFGWDRESRRAILMHQRNLLLHHKSVVVNGKLMGLGSYNWSESAESRNFENIMVFEGSTPQSQDVIDRFMAEFNYIWDRVLPVEIGSNKLQNPQVISGYEGRKLKKQIVRAYNDRLCRRIMNTLHFSRGVCSEEKLLESLTRNNASSKNKEGENSVNKDFESKITKLKEARLIFTKGEEKNRIFYLSD